MKTKSLRQSATFKAKPQQVYDALMESKQHAKFSGSKASISKVVGGKFKAYDNYLEGTNLELKKNKKIVQAWRAVSWPAGHYSRATFSMAPVKGGSRLSFYQSGIPVEHFESIKKGWITHYWQPMKKMLDK
jgi:activator of HSP90 ATPase